MGWEFLAQSLMRVCSEPEQRTGLRENWPGKRVAAEKFPDLALNGSAEFTLLEQGGGDPWWEASFTYNQLM